ncbi:hypothetical protein [Neorhodopirellula pilleata]|uniref:hypothetical protein n=1 Tax=Neorhodopirellula pilleata TaxID=2714738 RepID=UPI0011B66066|nr:hypothetical protein [Neorhodopirellula pilleata]
MRCQRPTVGDGWHNLTTPGGASALILCQDCWDRTTPRERLGFLNVHLQRVGKSNDPVAAKLRNAIQ